MKRTVCAFIAIMIFILCVPALGDVCTEHDYEEYIYLPTCTDDGYTIFTCMICSYEYVSEYVPPIGHDEIYTILIEPTCTEYGTTDVVYCNNCGEITKDWESIPPLGHEFYPITVANGLMLIDYKCLRCDEDIPRNCHEYLDEELMRLLNDKEITHEYEPLIIEFEKIFLSMSKHETSRLENKDILFYNIDLFAIYRMGDINLDGEINYEDISVMLSSYSSDEKVADIDNSGTVNSDDLSLLLSNYGLDTDSVNNS